MKKLALMFPLLIMLACGKAPLVTQGTPEATQGLPTCSGANFPIKKGSSSSCAQIGSSFQLDGVEVWHVIGTQGGGGLAHRYLGPACTTRTRTCGSSLYYGPCGAALDPNEDPAWVGGRNAAVFLPAAGHGVGYQVTTYYGQYSNNVFSPEPYTHQILYPPVTATCPFTACIGPGIPAIEVTLAILSLNVPAGTSLGRVLSDPPGITLQGSGEASGLFPGDVTLIAEPTGSHVRAVFSGDCERAGEYGQRAECIVKLAPDPNVTVTFECQKGFTCGGASKD